MSSTSPTGPTKKAALGKRQVAAGLLAVVVIVFAVLNGQSVKVHWIVTTTRSPLVVVIAVSALIGAAIGAIIRRRRQRHRLPPPPPQ